MAEIRDAFEAYASGALAEVELRHALREAVYKEPETVPRYVSMAAALRRRNLISAELEAAVVSDMRSYAELAGNAPQPDFEAPTRALPANDVRATRSDNTRDTGPGTASWDSKDKLNETEAPVALGLVLRERFELVEELGRGGMGVVYKALDQREIENRGREPYVAIKVLNEEFKRHPESARALQRESRKAMKLAHPNIVLVRDFDRDRGNVYMVMELLHGQPLDQLLLQQYPNGMPIEMVMEMVTGLGAALSYAHQQGIVHADFKPSNAFLTSQRVVKVLDFGVARAALALDRGESTLFDAGKLNAVSPAYASVEMLTGGSPDARDDIYALGCVTYFLLTGRHPFNGIDVVKARDASLQPPPIKGLGDHQWQALRGALMFERWNRTASVRDFVARFCTAHPTRITQLTTGVTKLAAGATKLASQTTRRASSVVRTPAFLAAPIGALLVAAITMVVVREWTIHKSAPVAANQKNPAVARVAPAQRPPEPARALAGAKPTIDDPLKDTARADATTKLRDNDVQKPLLKSYLQQAKRQLLDADPTAALQTITAGRKKFGGSVELKNIEVTYDRVAEELERITLAPTLGVRDHTEWIGEIRQLAGDDFPWIEQLLARALANDIADQRAKGNRDGVVKNLLASGKQLFPEYEAQLDHGIAGMENPDQIVVAGETADTLGTDGAQPQAQQ